MAFSGKGLAISFWIFFAGLFDIDVFYKRISVVKEAAGELWLEPSACDGMVPRRVKHDGFGVGLVVGADYNFSYDRDRPQFSVGVDCRTDYNFFGKPGVQDSDTSSFPSEVGAPSTLDFGCQAGFKIFLKAKHLQNTIL